MLWIVDGIKFGATEQEHPTRRVGFSRVISNMVTVYNKALDLFAP